MIPRTILVADDDPLLRESLCEAIADMGIAVRTAADGGSAIRCLEQEACGLLLSDVDMPDMTGFQLLEWVHAHPPEPPVLLMSARADTQLAQSARAAGALGLLPKPVHITELSGLVRNIFSL